MYIANNLKKVKAIITFTDSNKITSIMSHINSKLPIFVLSKNKNILNLLTLYRGVIPIFFNKKEKNIKNAIDLLCNKGFLSSGNLVIFTEENANNAFETININHIIKIK